MTPVKPPSRMATTDHRRPCSGFSLIELAVVIAIIAGLVAMLVPAT